MKKYNEKILEANKKIRDKTYSKAMGQVNKATNPSPKILRIGAIISESVGFVLLIAGAVGVIFRSKIWGWSFLCSGLILVVVNCINLFKTVSKRNN